MREFPLHKLVIRYNFHDVYVRFTMRQFPLHKLTYMVQCRNVYVQFTMREFPLHELTIRNNGTIYTYDLPCGSSPYINWLDRTMPKCLRTIYLCGSFPLHKLTNTVQWCNVYVQFTMREFPLHKLTIRYNTTMFTYDLPCGSSPYIKWLYGTIP